MRKNRQLSIIVDTNLWISFLISKRQDRLDDLLLSGRVHFLFSAELLQEIEITITKPKLKKYFEPNAMDEMLSSLELYIDFVEVKSSVDVCRDIKDNFLLALAKDGNADYLLTGDNDLLEVGKFGRTHILTITDFLSTIR